MHDVVFIADVFVEQLLGGGELNNDELINLLIDRGHKVLKINSNFVNEAFIEKHKNSKFIVANFANLPTACRRELYDKDYIIYEHDHKYLTTRDPGAFKDYTAPKEKIVNYDFYKEALAVLCQSGFHLDIIKKNLMLNNLINLGGNLWSTAALDTIEQLAQTAKKNKCSILNSNIAHKNTREAIMYCEHKKLQYELVASKNYNEFLTQLGSNNQFIFFPKTPETLSRVVVEARMMGMSTITNNKIGATKEPWFEMKGPPLIEFMRNKRKEIVDVVENALLKGQTV